jgi:sec-independent protein translocase protein TatC
MPFLDHLGELRDRLRNSALALIICTVVAYVYRGMLFKKLVSPLIVGWNAAQKSAGLGVAELVFISPGESLLVFLKLSLYVGLFTASPFIFREIWKFIAPGLYPHERRYGAAFVATAALLFIGGAAFAYLYVLPAAYKFFLSFHADSMDLMRNSLDVPVAEQFTIRPMITMDEYFGMTSMIVLVFGLVFELPLVLSILALLGIVTAGQLWRFNRYAILLFAIAGAVLTPGDLVIGQLAMTGSLTVLYNLSILLALVVQRRKKDEAASDSVDEAAAT